MFSFSYFFKKTKNSKKINSLVRQPNTKKKKNVFFTMWTYIDYYSDD